MWKDCQRSTVAGSSYRILRTSVNFGGTILYAFGASDSVDHRLRPASAPRWFRGNCYLIAAVVACTGKMSDDIAMLDPSVLSYSECGGINFCPTNRKLQPVSVRCIFRNNRGDDERTTLSFHMTKLATEIPSFVNKFFINTESDYSCSTCVGVSTDVCKITLIQLPPHVDAQDW
uniref:Uncharacterized protein n=1 Tax=Tetranychus urticae TaxID=32264 RepID=T1JXP6_TETUR